MTTIHRCPLCGEHEGYSVSEGSSFRWRFLDCHSCVGTVTEVRGVDPTQPGPVPEPRYDTAWNEASQYAQSLRNGNLALLESLMDMCSQYLKQPGSDHIWHSFMSAGEGAMEALAQAGMIQVLNGNYTLDWEALERRRKGI